MLDANNHEDMVLPAVESYRLLTRVLGMQLESFMGGSPPVERKAFKFGNQKINLHLKGNKFKPKAKLPTPGALDLCFIASIPLEQVMRLLEAVGWPIEEGPVLRTGATRGSGQYT